jgi:hypothetical protein
MKKNELINQILKINSDWSKKELSKYSAFNLMIMVQLLKQNDLNKFNLSIISQLPISAN